MGSLAHQLLRLGQRTDDLSAWGLASRPTGHVSLMTGSHDGKEVKVIIQTSAGGPDERHSPQGSGMVELAPVAFNRKI